MNINKYARWVKFYFSNNPFYTIFYVTPRCNARCIHCFAWEMIENEHKRNVLTLDEIEKIAQNWGDMLIINLAGGEAYLRNELPEIVDIWRRNTGVEMVAIPSNGIQTKRIVGIINQLLENYPDIHFRFSFSIDGIGDLHDEIRKSPGCFAAVTKTVREVVKLKNKHKNFTILTNSCFMSHNQNEFKEVLKYINKELKVDFLSVTYIRGESPDKETQKSLMIDRYKEAVEYLSSLNYKNFENHPMADFIMGSSTYTNDKVIENIELNQRNFKCYAIKKMINIDDEGEVKICESLPTSLGNLRDFDYDIKNIVKTKFANQECNKIKNYECNCTWECAIRTGIMYNPKEYYSIMKSAKKHKSGSVL